MQRTDQSFIIKERLRSRQKYHRLYKDKKQSPNKQLYMQSYKERYPEKQKAKNLAGKIKCEKGMEKHHWSYNVEHAKDVIIVPIALHDKLHRYMTYDQKAMMYRTSEGALLDTKEKHENFISIIKLIP